MGEKIDDAIEGIQYLQVKNQEGKWSCSIVDLKKTDNIPYHKHEKTRTIYTLVDGTGTLVLDGEEIPMPKCIEIPPWVPHTVYGEMRFICYEQPPDTGDFIHVDLEYGK